MSALLEFVLAESDPANAALLLAIYWRLKSEHREVREYVTEIRDRVSNLEEEHPEIS